MNSTRRPFFSRQGIVALLAACSLLSLGCGTAEYEKGMAETIEKLRLQNRFVNLVPVPTLIGDPAKNPGVSVGIRLPKNFAKVSALTSESHDPNVRRMPNSPVTKIPVDRVEPPFLRIPGFQLTFEQMVKDKQRGMRTMSLYFGIEPITAASKETIDKIPGELQAALKLESNVAWNNESVVRPDGTTAPWRFIQIEGPQAFYTTNIGSTPDMMQGTFGIWVHEALGHYIVMAYRLPTNTSEVGYLPEAVRSAAGTLQVTPKAAVPAGTPQTGAPQTGAPQVGAPQAGTQAGGAGGVPTAGS